MLHKEQPKLFVKGHVLITDITDPNNVITVLDRSNAIHSENMSYAIANSLSYVQDSSGVPIGSISSMHFGNGGSTIIGTGRILYKQPRVTSFGGLYSETYKKNINARINPGIDEQYNYISTVHIPGQSYSDVVCICTLGLGEPVDQNASSSNDLDGTYVFDELGLYTDGDSGSPLSHIIFHPVEKSANRVLQIKYTVRIQLQ